MTDLTIRLDQLDALAGLLPEATPPRTVADIARWGVGMQAMAPEGAVAVTLTAELDDSKLAEHLAWLTERMAYDPARRVMLTEGDALPADAEEPSPAAEGVRLPSEGSKADDGGVSRARHLPGGVTEWTDEEKQLLERMWAEGASLAEISAALPGRTVRSVGEKRRKIGLPARVTQPVEQGEAAVTTAVDAPEATEADPAESPEQAPEVAPAAPEVAPAAPEVAPAAPEVAAPRMRPAGLTPGAARIFEAMAGLDDSFAPDDDKLLVEQRFKGAAMGGIAVELGCDEATVTKRWKQIRGCKVDHKGGLMTSRGWADLRAAAALRAELLEA